MDEKKKITEEFKDEMGFKSCDLSNTQTTNNQELFGTQRPTLDMDCKNSSSIAYECTGLIDVNKKKVFKSTCEEKIRK
ncbi:MAG: hypothetical protein ACFFEY_20135 [Candidatus Thorarchaeota archaeon]